MGFIWPLHGWAMQNIYLCFKLLNHSYIQFMSVDCENWYYQRMAAEQLTCWDRLWVGTGRSWVVAVAAGERWLSRSQWPLVRVGRSYVDVVRSNNSRWPHRWWLTPARRWQVTGLYTTCYLLENLQKKYFNILRFCWRSICYVAAKGSTWQCPNEYPRYRHQFIHVYFLRRTDLKCVRFNMIAFWWYKIVVLV